MKWFRRSKPVQELNQAPDPSKPEVKVRTIELSATVCHALSLTQEAYGLREREDFARAWGYVDVRIEELDGLKIVQLKGTLVEPLRNAQPFGGGTNNVQADCSFQQVTHDKWSHWKPVSVELDRLYVYDVEEYVDDEQWIRYRLKEREEPMDDFDDRSFDSIFDRD